MDHRPRRANTNPDKARLNKKKDEQKHEQALEDIQSIMSTRSGRRYLWDKMRRCGVFQTSFTGNSETFFKEGMRNIGLIILSEMTEASPENYLLAMKESKEDQENA